VVVAGEAFTIEARSLAHRVPTVGYRLTEPDGRRMRPDLLVAHGISGPDISKVQKMGRIIRNGRVVHLAEVSESRTGQKFAFVMDTRLCDAAFELARDADMLVCEATFVNADAELADEYGHLTAGQAGRVAAEAGVRLLVLTHFSQRYGSGEMDRFASEAAQAFDGDIVIANDLDRIPVPRRLRSSDAAGQAMPPVNLSRRARSGQIPRPARSTPSRGAAEGAHRR
jgi:ribonuclease Z